MGKKQCPSMRRGKDARHGNSGSATAKPMIGASIETQTEHKIGVAKTKNKQVTEETVKSHHNKLKTIMAWIKEKHPQCAEEGGIVKASENDLADPTKFFHTNTEDLVHDGMNVDVILACFADMKQLKEPKKQSTKKKKRAGTFRSCSSMTKFHNAILHGARSAEQALPEDHHIKVGSDFLPACRKEATGLLQSGEMDTSESDPIPFPLLRLICQCALDTGNIFLWVFGLLQWSCMGRSISIDPLGFHNFTVGSDSIKVTCDKSKADQVGEKVSPKNLCTNPLEPHICVFTALAVWISLNKTQFELREKLFLFAGKTGAAASRCCEQLVELLKSFRGAVCKFARPDRTGAHGTRKGAALFAASGTTNPLPLPSIARRGEWSQGTVFDVCFLFAEPGDQCLGRCTAGLDPNSADFSVLPPHFTSVEEKDFREACDEATALCFGSMGTIWGIQSILSFLLALLAHNIDFIKLHATRDVSHPFDSLPLLQRADLTMRLQQHLSGGTKGKHPTTLQPTGMPPHVQQCKLLQELLTTTAQTLQKVNEMVGVVESAVHSAMESNDVRSGQMTMDLLANKLGGAKEELILAVRSVMDERLGAAAVAERKDASVSPPELEDGKSKGGHQQCMCRIPGKLQAAWHVPEGWEFPKKVNRSTGWCLWMSGQPANQMTDRKGHIVSCPVRPFRLLSPKMLPSKKLQDQHKTQWKPLFLMMEAGLSSEIPEVIDSSVALRLYNEGTDHLRLRASYMWQLKGSKPETWKISSWAKRIMRSAIEKDGTDSDKAQLPLATINNKSHPEYNRAASASRKRKAEFAHDSIGNKGVPNKKPLKTSDDVSAEQVGCGAMADSILGESDDLTTPGQNPALPNVGDAVISCAFMSELRRQGQMIKGSVVRGYLNTLVRPHFDQGVKAADDSFFSSGSWKAYSNRGGHQIDFENDNLIFAPIFTGDASYGHFSLLVVDRTLWDDGIFIYFDSYPSGSKAIAERVSEYLKTSSLWKEHSVFHHCQKMPAQYSRSQDCGIFTCCLAALYLRSRMIAGVFDKNYKKPESLTKMAWVRAEFNGPGAEHWGRRGRAHIEHSLRKNWIDPSDQALRELNLHVLVDN